MGKLLAIANREVRSYLRDRADLAFSLLLPVAIFALMYGAFSGQALFNGTAYVVNEDAHGTYALQLIQRLSEREGLEVAVLSRADADAKLERSDILVVTFIPEGFSARLEAGWPTGITFRQRGNGGTEGQIVAAMVRATANAMSQEIQLQRQVQLALAERGLAGEPVTTTVQGLLQREKGSPTVAVQQTSIGGAADLVHLFLPGILSMFVLFAMTLGSRALVVERRLGTLERLLTTHLSVAQLYAGKLLAGIARGLVQVLILLLLAGLVFRLFTPASFGAMLGISVLFVTATSALALIIAAIARTEDQAITMSVVFTMATVMLGGTFFPIPPGSVLQSLSRLSINTYVNTMYQAVLAGNATVDGLSTELLVLCGAILAGLAISRALFRVVPGGR